MGRAACVLAPNVHESAPLTSPSESIPAVSPARRINLVLALLLLAAVVGGVWLAGPERIAEFFRLLRDLRGLVQWGGYTVLGIIVFAETGLLVGFFLPGDSLLVTAGVFAATDLLDIWILNLLLAPLAILGDAVNYWMGRRTGEQIYARPDGRLFKRAYVTRTQEFYERYGGKTIVIARFVPIIRTFAPFIAGVGRMKYRRFLAFNVIGAVAWVASMTLAGYFLATSFPNIEQHLHIVIAIVIVLSILPGVFEILRERRRRTRQALEKPPS